MTGREKEMPQQKRINPIRAMTAKWHADIYGEAKDGQHREEDHSIRGKTKAWHAARYGQQEAQNKKKG